MKRRHGGWRLMIGACAVALASTACSNEPELVFEDDDPPPELAFFDAEPIVEGRDRDLVQFDASWLCEIDRRTFSTLNERDGALAVALADAEIEPEEYLDFKARLSGDRELRNAVLYHYQDRCLS